MAPSGITQIEASQTGISHNDGSPNTILSLANQLTELAVLQTHQVSVPQEDFLQAIQRLQIAVERPAHYVARKRHEV